MDQLFQALLQGGQHQDEEIEEEDQEMTPQDFIRELSKYPVVRQKNFQALKQVKKEVGTVSPMDTQVSEKLHLIKYSKRFPAQNFLVRVDVCINQKKKYFLSKLINRN